MMDDLNMGKVEGAGEYSRPRRANPDTASYLRSLPIDLSLFAGEVKDAEEKNVREPTPTLSVSLAAISEIRDEIASLATEETSAEIVEILCRIAGPYSDDAARVLLNGVSGYAIFLSTHRYGSHVLQTILEVASEKLSDKDLFDTKDMVSNTEELSTIQELVIGISAELLPVVADLAVHICGSHVLRTLACALGGVKADQSDAVRRLGRRGKSKKKKKKAVADNQGRTKVTETLAYTSSRIDYKDSTVTKSLSRLVTSISGEAVEEPGRLQQLALHPSASPLLGVLLRVLTYRDARSTWEKRLSKIDTDKTRLNHHLAVHKPEPRMIRDHESYALACRILCRLSETDEQEWTADVVYELSGEPHGSHLLESIIRLSNDDLFEGILHDGKFVLETTVQEYIEHDVSNFVLQGVLASIMNESQANKMMEVLSKFVSSGYIIQLSNRRRGILFRLVELASRYSSLQRLVLKSMREGFMKIGLVKSMSNGLVSCVPEFLKMASTVGSAGGRLTIDVSGARILFYMLRFEPKYCEEALLGICKLSAEELVLLAKDGLGSRCVWDGVLEGPVNENHFSSAVKRLLKMLEGQWVVLACDRVGYHVVQKVFRRLVDMGDRETLALELSGGLHRLSGNNMGRSIVESCAIREYTEMSAAEWGKMLKRRIETEGWHKNVPLPSSEGNPTKKRERKRKREKPSGLKE